MKRSSSTLSIFFRETYLKGLLFSGLACLIACANPISPTGGPLDEQPPQVDSLESTPNYQTSFSGRSFELTFDEWVVLEDIQQQVVVSPPLDFEVTLKRKTVTFEVKEGDTLRANTTYTVNFGEAVKDLTEKNPAENLRFIFSTGTFLDSLSMSGRILAIETREPVEGAYFMLYDNLADSVVRTQRPYYFGRTDKQGFFEINNLKAGTYKGFALKTTGPASYIYNNIGAQIGFADTLITISPNSSPDLNLSLFIEARPLRFLSSEAKTYGQVKLVFNQAPPADLELILPDSINFNYTATEVDKDTFRLWYDTDANSSWQFIIRKDSLVEDTISVGNLSLDNFLSNARLSQLTSRGTANLAPGQAIEIEWNHPLQAIDSNLLFLTKDSTTLRPTSYEIDSSNFRLLRIKYPFQQDSLYKLRLEPGALLDQFGLINDTVDINFVVGNVEDYGTIILSFTNLDSTAAYLVELLQGSTLIDTFFVKNQSNFDYIKKTLKPSSYALRIILDTNNNQKWDTGSYDEQRQAETIFNKKLEQLRANWELEVTIDLNELRQPAAIEAELPTNTSRPGGRN